MLAKISKILKKEAEDSLKIDTFANLKDFNAKKLTSRRGF